MVKLFVYGLIRPGKSLFHVVEQECIEHREMTLSGYKLYTDGTLTFISPHPESNVAGDLLILDAPENELFYKLDAIEGFKGEGRVTNLYDRIKIDDIWVYVAGKLFREKYCQEPSNR